MVVHCKSLIWFCIIPLILVPGGLLICYGIALRLGHIPSIPQWPEVSDLGAKPPESCLFTLCFNWAAFFNIVTGFIYYRYIEQYGRKSNYNLAAFVMAFISSFGMTVVGAFQEEYLDIIHYIGAVVGFVAAIMFGWVIVYITHLNLTSEVRLKCIFYLRISLSIFQTIVGIILVVALILEAEEKLKYKTFAAIMEWTLTYTCFAIGGTLIYELGVIRSVQVDISVYKKTNRYESGKV